MSLAQPHSVMTNNAKVKTTPMPTDLETALKAQLIEQRFAALELSNSANTLKIAQLTSEKEKALVWGIVMLGSGVIGLVVWVFNLISGHAK